MIVPTLQQIALEYVDTHTILQSNLQHLLGVQNRFVRDLQRNDIGPIDEYFLSTILDIKHTSFFWMTRFINKQIHRLKMNTAVMACWQEYYTPGLCLMVFAMRINFNQVAMFIYTISSNMKHMIPNKVLEQKKTDKWTPDEWRFLDELQLESIFSIKSEFQQ